MLLMLQKPIRLQDKTNPPSVLLTAEVQVSSVDYGLAARMEFLWAQWGLGKDFWPPISARQGITTLKSRRCGDFCFPK